jgi:hypothetical protein
MLSSGSFANSNHNQILNDKLNPSDVNNDLTRTLRSILPHANISFGPPSSNNSNNNNNNNNSSKNFPLLSSSTNNGNGITANSNSNGHSSNTNNYWPDDPAIVSLTDGLQAISNMGTTNNVNDFRNTLNGYTNFLASLNNSNNNKNLLKLQQQQQQQLQYQQNTNAYNHLFNNEHDHYMDQFNSSLKTAATSNLFNFDKLQALQNNKELASQSNATPNSSAAAAAAAALSLQQQLYMQQLSSNFCSKNISNESQ